MLKKQFPGALQSLNDAQGVIRSLLRDHETDPAIRELVHSNYNDRPEMRKVLSDFVQSKLHMLPTLVFTKENGCNVRSYPMN
ncbi:hypothetical protein R1flu_023410 [Riccia fluitans]|uniref:Uncharacterized protein n=1 Tax=Riccia fluitans TaxID=41844 RepID=A0ABD1XSS1_9MARC